MNIKRLLTGIIGFPIVLAILVLANKHVIDVLLAIVALISVYEFTKCAKNKEINVISWIGYLSCLLIGLLHILPMQNIPLIIAVAFPLIIFILFLHVILTNMKITFQDISVTLFGTLYIVGFIMFFALLYGSDISVWNLNGKIAIWYILFASWGTDTCAYIAGKNFGKHKFSKVSPNKTIEGCLGGTIGSVIGGLIFTYAINTLLGCNVPYFFAAILLTMLSIIGQVGDFAASVIKRYFEVKDFSELFPGHGGMLDRIDSIIFIAPFAYIVFVIANLII